MASRLGRSILVLTHRTPLLYKRWSTTFLAVFTGGPKLQINYLEAPTPESKSCRSLFDFTLARQPKPLISRKIRDCTGCRKTHALRQVRWVQENCLHHIVSKAGSHQIKRILCTFWSEILRAGRGSLSDSWPSPERNVDMKSLCFVKEMWPTCDWINTKFFTGHLGCLQLPFFCHKSRTTCCLLTSSCSRLRGAVLELIDLLQDFLHGSLVAIESSAAQRHPEVKKCRT